MYDNVEKKIFQSEEYNPGGISHIFLLDTDHFLYYKFSGNKRFDVGLVEKIRIKKGTQYIQIAAENESSFSESQSGGVYQQKLNTFVGTLQGCKLNDLLQVANRKYLILFWTHQGKGYTFGSDGGASVNFSQQSGKLGEAAGYNISIDKKSIFPLFEVDLDILCGIDVLGTEDLWAITTEKNELILTEDE